MSDDSVDNPTTLSRYWSHCAGGLHIGRMDPRPLAGEFGAVLTVAIQPGKIDPELRHKHVPISYVLLDPDALANAVGFVLEQFAADRTVLVRSEGGLQRPALVVALVCIRLGASFSEALSCVRKNQPRALSDFRYLHLLEDLYRVQLEDL